MWFSKCRLSAFKRFHQNTALVGSSGYSRQRRDRHSCHHQCWSFPFQNDGNITLNFSWGSVCWHSSLLSFFSFSISVFHPLCAEGSFCHFTHISHERMDVELLYFEAMRYTLHSITVVHHGWLKAENSFNDLYRLFGLDVFLTRSGHVCKNPQMQCQLADIKMHHFTLLR